MNNNENPRNNVEFILYLLVGLLLFLMVCSTTSCTTTRYIPVESVKHDSVYVNTISIDTIFKTDSTVIQLKGDTTLIDRWHTLYKVSLKRDTLVSEKNDTIRVPYEVVKEKIEYKTPFLAKILAWLGGVALIIILSFLILHYINKKVLV